MSFPKHTQPNSPMKHGFKCDTLTELKYYGSNFTAKIVPSSVGLYPFSKISGRVFLNTKLAVRHKGIHIQLEALCRLRYTANVEWVKVLFEKRGCVVGDKIKKVVILKELFGVHQPAIILAGSEIFPFSLEIPGDVDLPVPFKNQFGSLSYRLVVYVKSGISFLNGFAEVGERTLRFGGYVNLLNNPNILKPVSVKQSLSKSLLSKVKIVEVELSLQSSGFLIGENLHFEFRVKSCKCIPLQIGILLLQIVEYNACGESDGVKAVKMIPTVVSRKEKDYAEPEPEFTWMDFLPLGEQLKPSFSSEMLTITYILQFRVIIAKRGVLKGESPVTIGTTRDSMEMLRERGNHGDFLGPSWRRGRSVSRISIGSTLTLPPAYSQLSSRRSSLETLPPCYDDLGLPEDIYGASEMSKSTSVIPDALDSAMERLQMREGII